MALLKTISIQSKELKNSREELRLTREELAKSAEAQERSSQIFEQQRFENTFFLLETLNLGIEIFKHNNEQYFENYGDYNNPALKCIANFSKIAILIYQILKFINDYNEKQNIAKEQGFEYKKYSSILRACLDEDILQLLLINCYDEEIADIHKFRQLMEKYNMLEHMPTEASNIMKNHINLDDARYGIYINKIKTKYTDNGYKNIFGNNLTPQI